MNPFVLLAWVFACAASLCLLVLPFVVGVAVWDWWQDRRLEPVSVDGEWDAEVREWLAERAAMDVDEDDEA